MKRKFELFILIAVFASPAVNGQNTSGASGSAGSATPAPASRSAATANQSNGQNNQNNGANVQGQSPATLMRREQTMRGFGATNNFGFGSNQFGINTNQFGINTNRFQTNSLALGATNRLGSSPTSAPGFTNRVYSSNNPAAGPYDATNRLGPASSYGTNTSNTGTSKALTPADQTLMLSVRQAVQGAFAAGIQPTVSYIVSGGVVTLAGLVPTMQEKLAVQAVATGVPGVTRVINNIQVNNAAVTAGSNSVPTSTGLSNPSTLSALNQRRAVVTNGVSLGSTNLAPTSFSNNPSRIYSPTRTGLPPGLENREVLPPGLQNREQLPPGLANPTNSTP